MKELSDCRMGKDVYRDLLSDVEITNELKPFCIIRRDGEQLGEISLRTANRLLADLCSMETKNSSTNQGHLLGARPSDLAGEDKISRLTSGPFWPSPGFFAGQLGTALICLPQPHWRANAGAGLMAAAGFYQGYRDFNNFQKCESNWYRAKYSGCLALDAGMVASSGIHFAKFGPKWLAPALMLGTVVARATVDMVDFALK